ncbi:MAG TPA: PocR ligand-binding domain-containing protein, partial [Verrucomicrobiae bacterium]
MQTIIAKSVPPTATDEAAASLPAVAPQEMVENSQDNRALVEALANSRIYRDYERAFGDLTGLPVALQPVETWQLPHHGKRNENEFCALLSRKNRSCAACLQTQEHLCQKALTKAETLSCPVGLSDTAVPVRMSDRLVGYLRFGQVFRRKPTEAQFKKT